MLERIKELCKTNNIPISKLEEELNFSSGYIYKLDKSSPSIDKINKIADYFGVSIDYLVSGKM